MDPAASHPDPFDNIDFDLTSDARRVRASHLADGAVVVQVACKLPLDADSNHTVTITFAPALAHALINVVNQELGWALTCQRGEEPVEFIETDAGDWLGVE